MIATVMYRNPMEEWLWESGMGYWIYGILGIILVAAVSLVAFAYIEEWWRNRK